MANAVLLNAVTGDTTGTGASRSGPCTVTCTGSMGGGRVIVQVAIADTAALYTDGTVAEIRENEAHRPVHIDHVGTYYIRANLVESKTTAACTVNANQ